MRIDVNAFLGAYPWRKIPGTSPDALLQALQRTKIDSAWITHLPSLFWRDPTEGNAWLYETARNEKRFKPVPTVHPGMAEWEHVIADASSFGWDVTAAINEIAPVPLPAVLAGRTRLGSTAAAQVVGLAGYGPGLSSFVVFALPGRTGADALNAARERGAVPVSLPNADAYQTSTTLVNGLIVRTQGDRPNRRTYLIAGPVTPDVLRQAAAELVRR